MGLLYQRRRLKVNKIRRQIYSNRIILQRLRVLLSFVLIIGISYFCYWALKLPQWYINSEKLAKASSDTLKIYGNVITPSYKIINMVRQTQLPSVQIFRLDTTELEKNISQLQSIKKVYVRRYWFPARLIVNVEERTPVFLLAPNLESEANSALTSDGVLIDKEYLPLSPSIQTKKMLTYGVKDGKDEVWDKKRVDELLKIIKAFEHASGQEVQYIDLRNQKDVYVMLEEYAIRVGEINDTIFARIKWIATILPEARKYADKVKYIDLRWEDSYYLRLKESKEEIRAQKIKEEQTPTLTLPIQAPLNSEATQQPQEQVNQEISNKTKQEKQEKVKQEAPRKQKQETSQKIQQTTQIQPKETVKEETKAEEKPSKQPEAAPIPSVGASEEVTQ